MTFAYDDGQDGRSMRAGIRKIIATWVSDSATGAASGTTAGKVCGSLLKAVTIPASGGSAPTDNYDIAITDENSVDVLGSCKKGLADRDTANTEEQYFLLLNNDGTALSMALFPVVCEKLTFAVTNAGNSKGGTITLYYKPAA